CRCDAHRTRALRHAAPESDEAVARELRDHARCAGIDPRYRIGNGRGRRDRRLARYRAQGDRTADRRAWTQLHDLRHVLRQHRLRARHAVAGPDGQGGDAEDRVKGVSFREHGFRDRHLGVVRYAVIEFNPSSRTSEASSRPSADPGPSTNSARSALFRVLRTIFRWVPALATAGMTRIEFPCSRLLPSPEPRRARYANYTRPVGATAELAAPLESSP